MKRKSYTDLNSAKRCYQGSKLYITRSKLIDYLCKNYILHERAKKKQCCDHQQR